MRHWRHPANRKPGLLPDKIGIGFAELDPGFKLHFLQVDAAIPGAHDKHCLVACLVPEYQRISNLAHLAAECICGQLRGPHRGRQNPYLELKSSLI
jgi:hypothetical protein